MVIAGIGLGILIGIPFFNVEGISPFIYMTLFWCTLLSLGLVKTATRTLSTLEKNRKNDDKSM
jgi:hypothetical protein